MTDGRRLLEKLRAAKEGVALNRAAIEGGLLERRTPAERTAMMLHLVDTLEAVIDMCEGMAWEVGKFEERRPPRPPRSTP